MLNYNKIDIRTFLKTDIHMLKYMNIIQRYRHIDYVYEYCTNKYNNTYIQLHMHARAYARIHTHTYIIYVYIFSRSRKTHPGAVVHLSDNPLDLSKVRVFLSTFYFALFSILTMTSYLTFFNIMSNYEMKS